MRNGGNLAVALTMLVIFSMGSVSAQSQIPFGADVFIGGIPGSGEPTDGETVAEFPRMGGWEVGASLRHGQSLQWLGWPGAYARHSNDQVRVRELLGGVRATSPWLFAADGMTRAFGHALTGYAWSRSTVSDRSPVLVLGGGFDVFFSGCNVTMCKHIVPVSQDIPGAHLSAP